MSGQAARPAADEQTLAHLDRAWGDEYDLGVSDTGRWWARRTGGDEPEIIRATAAGLDAALRVGRMP